MTPRELLTTFGLVALLLLAFRVFDEVRDLIQGVAQLVVPGLVAFFVARAFWRWWSAQPPTIAAVGAWLGLGVALVGWLNVALATWVAGLNQGNYALIVIVPLAWMLGLAVSMAGLLAAGLGVAVTITGASHAMPARGWVVAAGLAAVILNLTPILRLISIFSGH